ncbi:unnamed protein product [Aphis gossypii]|uniref:Secreted protein n=1 Tax=Aphis gossypii TaxID=80765 RepID=A0A9P0J760_APHGO|nr:unnamed protein product [Aphis gossypii]
MIFLLLTLLVYYHDACDHYYHDHYQCALVLQRQLTTITLQGQRRRRQVDNVNINATAAADYRLPTFFFLSLLSSIAVAVVSEQKPTFGAYRFVSVPGNIIVYTVGRLYRQAPLSCLAPSTKTADPW